MYKEKKIKAIELRKSGWAITKIAIELKVAKSSVSLWVRDLPQPEHFKKKKKLKRKKKKERVTKKCLKCDNAFLITMKIEGKRVNLRNRHYCLDCSPYKGGNNRVLHLITGKCIYCGKDIKIRRACNACRVKQSHERRWKKILDIIGYYCIKCDYGDINKYRVLEMHHVDPSKKLFHINKDGMRNGWEKVKEELLKCIPMCPTCHREYHVGILTQKELEELKSNFWNMERLEKLNKFGGGPVGREYELEAK